MAATRVLYMEERKGQEPDPCYLREFNARVVERGPDFVVLDQTAFYAEGGGQPYDTGLLRWDDEEARILRVTKEKGVVRHVLSGRVSIAPSPPLLLVPLQYPAIPMHTSQHLMS